MRTGTVEKVTCLGISRLDAMNGYERIKLFIWPLRLPPGYELASRTSAVGTGLSVAFGASYFLPHGHIAFIATVILGSFVGRWVGLAVIWLAPGPHTKMLRGFWLLWVLAAVAILVWATWAALSRRDLVFLTEAFAISATPTVALSRLDLRRAFACIELTLAFVCMIVLLITRNPLAGLSSMVCALIAGYLFGGLRRSVRLDGFAAATMSE